MLSSVAAACSSKLNLRQKRLRSASPQARLIRLPNGEWMTSCMPPASSKKRSSTSVSCVGRHSSAANDAVRYSSSCSAAGVGDADLVGQPALRAAAGRVTPQPGGDASTQTRHRGGKFIAAAGRLAEPERDGRRLAVRVLHPHHAALDAHDPIGGVAELEHVASEAFDSEVLIDAADRLVLGFQQHLVVGRVGDRATGGQRGQSRATPAAQHMVDRVVMDQRAASAAAGGEALGQHVHDSGESRRATESRYGQARRSRSYSASSGQSCVATSATICCASTSSG